MATATFFPILFHLLFITFSMFSTIATAQQVRSSNISIDSSLSPTNNTSSPWLSKSGRFAFGFYPQDGGFVVGIWFAGIPQKTVVWTAPPVLVKQTDSNNFRLNLTRDQGLILQSIQGQLDQDQSAISVISEPVAYASMLDTGNMVLYNSNSTIIWQSFDSPTDTILQGQLLRAGRSLFSKASETDYSKGRFQITMQNDGNLVQYPTDRRNDVEDYPYWSSGTFNTGDNVTVNLAESGRLYCLNRYGNSVKDMNPPETYGPTAETLFHRMTLDGDGIIKVYSHTLNGNDNWSMRWNSTRDKITDECSPRGICGLNAYCTLMDRKVDCICFPGFRPNETTRPFLDCVREISVRGCGTEEEGRSSNDTMQAMTNATTWEEAITYGTLENTTEEGCKDSCLNDCNCGAVRFQNQICKKQRLPLRYARKVMDASTIKDFFKVGTTNTTTITTNSTNGEVNKESKKSKKELQLPILIAIVSLVTASVLIFLGISCFLIYRNRFWSHHKILELGNSGLDEEILLRSFTYGELEKATDCFKEIVGRGSSGIVFKGALPHSQRLIAVKKLETMVDEGEREFQAEMRTIGKLHHKNLVQLLGYCHEGTNRLLVFEYMSNGSLADFLFKSQESPSWNERVQIAINIARGILYLHEECETQIIHCDIKPQNILMDEYRFAKIADFGLAKLLKRDQTKTHTGIRGTRGYVAPEWHRNLPITVKVDVYSYGIVLLEIICCRRRLNMDLPEDEVILVDWVFQCLNNGELGKLVSDDEVDMKRFERIISVALWCIQDEPSMRPSMKKVVLMLEGIIDIPRVGILYSRELGVRPNYHRTCHGTHREF